MSDIVKQLRWVASGYAHEDTLERRAADEIERLQSAFDDCAENAEAWKAEAERLRAIVDTAQRWRYAFHHGTREEIDLQEQCLLDALNSALEQKVREE